MSRWPSPPRHISSPMPSPLHSPLIWNTVALLSIYFNKSAVREYISASANPSKGRDKANRAEKLEDWSLENLIDEI